ncbi:MFS transporter [Paenibacillus sp. MBLB2552]|uniref:MFS transporter n=1 Tax=Paenibacillus mellifer TaxID=2937794 RepID=A0A9X1XVG7_9BACL|nr:MFS transporter [Paenibacillus mellifer]MCK8486089.1 MFS transporter [Paenibacillus mellifer]
MELTSGIARKKLLNPTFASLWLIMFLVEFVKGALIVSILPVYMGDVLSLSAFAIGLSFSMQYIGDNLFRSPAGWLIERIGFRRTMSLGLCITLGAVAVIAFLPTMGFLVLGCALLGIGTAPLWPCVLMGITAVTEENNNFATAMGVIQISSLGGTGLGPVIINFFLHDSYRPVFWFLLGCIALVVLISLLLPGKAGGSTAAGTAKSAVPGDASPSAKSGGMWSQLRASIRHIRTHLHVSPLLYPALFLQSFAVGLLTPVITLYVRTELGLSPETFSAMLVIGGGITVLGLIPIGKLVDRLGTRWFLHIGFALAAASIGLFALSREVSFVWLFVILIGCSYAFILPTWDTMISYLLPSGEKGTVWGLFLTIQGSGMVAGPIISGKMWDLIGPTAPFLASSATMALLFFLHIGLVRTEKASPKP